MPAASQTTNCEGLSAIEVEGTDYCQMDDHPIIVESSGHHPNVHMPASVSFNGDSYSVDWMVGYHDGHALVVLRNSANRNRTVRAALPYQTAE